MEKIESLQTQNIPVTPEKIDSQKDQERLDRRAQNMVSLLTQQLGEVLESTSEASGINLGLSLKQKEEILNILYDYRIANKREGIKAVLGKSTDEVYIGYKKDNSILKGGNPHASTLDNPDFDQGMVDAYHLICKIYGIDTSKDYFRIKKYNIRGKFNDVMFELFSKGINASVYSSTDLLGIPGSESEIAPHYANIDIKVYKTILNGGLVLVTPRYSNGKPILISGIELDNDHIVMDGFHFLNWKNEITKQLEGKDDRDPRDLKADFHIMFIENPDRFKSPPNVDRSDQARCSTLEEAEKIFSDHESIGIKYNFKFDAFDLLSSVIENIGKGGVVHLNSNIKGPSEEILIQSSLPAYPGSRLKSFVVSTRRTYSSGELEIKGEILDEASLIKILKKYIQSAKENDNILPLITFFKPNNKNKSVKKEAFEVDPTFSKPNIFTPNLDKNIKNWNLVEKLKLIDWGENELDGTYYYTFEVKENFSIKGFEVEPGMKVVFDIETGKIVSIRSRNPDGDQVDNKVIGDCVFLSFREIIFPGGVNPSKEVRNDQYTGTIVMLYCIECEISVNKVMSYVKNASMLFNGGKNTQCLIQGSSHFTSYYNPEKSDSFLLLEFDITSGISEHMNIYKNPFVVGIHKNKDIPQLMIAPYGKNTFYTQNNYYTTRNSNIWFNIDGTPSYINATGFDSTDINIEAKSDDFNVFFGKDLKKIEGLSEKEYHQTVDLINQFNPTIKPTGHTISIPYPDTTIIEILPEFEFDYHNFTYKVKADSAFLYIYPDKVILKNIFVEIIDKGTGKIARLEGKGGFNLNYYEFRSVTDTSIKISREGYPVILSKNIQITDEGLILGKDKKLEKIYESLKSSQSFKSSDTLHIPSKSELLQYSKLVRNKLAFKSVADPDFINEAFALVDLARWFFEQENNIYGQLSLEEWRIIYQPITEYYEEILSEKSVELVSKLDKIDLIFILYFLGKISHNYVIPSILEMLTRHQVKCYSYIIPELIKDFKDIDFETIKLKINSQSNLDLTRSNPNVDARFSQIEGFQSDKFQINDGRFMPYKPEQKELALLEMDLSPRTTTNPELFEMIEGMLRDNAQFSLENIGHINGLLKNLTGLEINTNSPLRFFFLFSFLEYSSTKLSSADRNTSMSALKQTKDFIEEINSKESWDQEFLDKYNFLVNIDLVRSLVGVASGIVQKIDIAKRLMESVVYLLPLAIAEASKVVENVLTERVGENVIGNQFLMQEVLKKSGEDKVLYANLANKVIEDSEMSSESKIKIIAQLVKISKENSSLQELLVKIESFEIMTEVKDILFELTNSILSNKEGVANNPNEFIVKSVASELNIELINLGIDLESNIVEKICEFIFLPTFYKKFFENNKSKIPDLPTPELFHKIIENIKSRFGEKFESYKSKILFERNLQRQHRSLIINSVRSLFDQLVKNFHHYDINITDFTTMMRILRNEGKFTSYCQQSAIMMMGFANILTSYQLETKIVKVVHDQFISIDEWLDLLNKEGSTSHISHVIFRIKLPAVVGEPQRYLIIDSSGSKHVGRSNQDSGIEHDDKPDILIVDEYEYHELENQTLKNITSKEIYDSTTAENTIGISFTKSEYERFKIPDSNHMDNFISFNLIDKELDELALNLNVKRDLNWELLVRRLSNMELRQLADELPHDYKYQKVLIDELIFLSAEFEIKDIVKKSETLNLISILSDWIENTEHSEFYESNLTERIVASRYFLRMRFWIENICPENMSNIGIELVQNFDYTIQKFNYSGMNTSEFLNKYGYERNEAINSNLFLEIALKQTIGSEEFDRNSMEKLRKCIIYMNSFGQSLRLWHEDQYFEVDNLMGQNRLAITDLLQVLPDSRIYCNSLYDDLGSLASLIFNPTYTGSKTELFDKLIMNYRYLGSSGLSKNSAEFANGIISLCKFAWDNNRPIESLLLINILEAFGKEKFKTFIEVCKPRAIFEIIKSYGDNIIELQKILDSKNFLRERDKEYIMETVLNYISSLKFAKENVDQFEFKSNEERDNFIKSKFTEYDFVRFAIILSKDKNLEIFTNIFLYENAPAFIFRNIFIAIGILIRETKNDRNLTTKLLSHIEISLKWYLSLKLDSSRKKLVANNEQEAFVKELPEIISKISDARFNLKNDPERSKNILFELLNLKILKETTEDNKEGVLELTNLVQVQLDEISKTIDIKKMEENPLRAESRYTEASIAISGDDAAVALDPEIANLQIDIHARTTHLANIGTHSVPVTNAKAIVDSLEILQKMFGDMAPAVISIIATNGLLQNTPESGYILGLLEQNMANAGMELLSPVNAVRLLASSTNPAVNTVLRQLPSNAGGE